MSKPVNLISPKNWSNAESDPVPSVKGSGKRPGTERIEARVPQQVGRKFKLLCALNHLEIKDVLTNLMSQWNDAMTGRPDGQNLDGQTARRPDGQPANSENPPFSEEICGTKTALDLMTDRLTDDDEERSFLTSSSNHSEGRPDGQPANKRREILAYYTLLTGNPIKQNDRDFLDTILEMPTAAIKGGIAQSLLRCTARINSLRYCAGAIEEIFEARASDNSFSVYLETVLLREGRWNSSLEPLDQGAMEATIRRRGLTQQNLPGSGADVVDIRPGQNERDPE